MQSKSREFVKQRHVFATNGMLQCTKTYSEVQTARFLQLVAENHCPSSTPLIGHRSGTKLLRLDLGMVTTSIWKSWHFSKHPVWRNPHCRCCCGWSRASLPLWSALCKLFHFFLPPGESTPKITGFVPLHVSMDAFHKCMSDLKCILQLQKWNTTTFLGFLGNEESLANGPGSVSNWIQGMMKA